MLQLLHIENIAVIERADISFRAGFNALTGETGAGKSIVIDSLGAVLGARTSRDLIRTGEVSAAATPTTLACHASALSHHADGGALDESRSATTTPATTNRLLGTTTLRHRSAPLPQKEP